MKLFQPLYEIIWLDQIAHVAAGYLLAVSCLIFMPWWAAFAASLAVGLVREFLQRMTKHPEPVPGGVWAKFSGRIRQCGVGCRTDLLFWFAGASSVPLVLFAATRSV